MTTNQPKISIITVCYNSEHTLEKTILSVINQTYANIEYIIIDGGSTDKTVEIIEKHAKSIGFWISEKDHGIYDAMNKGIHQATGDWIHIINSDDYYVHSKAIEELVPYLDAKKTNYCGIQQELHSGAVRNYTFRFNWYKLLYSAYLPHPGLIVSKEQYESVGLYDTQYRIAADHDLIMRLLKKYPALQHTTALSVMKAGGCSAQNYDLAFREFMKIIKGQGVPSIFAWTFYKIKTLRYKYLLLSKISNG